MLAHDDDDVTVDEFDLPKKSSIVVRPPERGWPRGLVICRRSLTDARGVNFLLKFLLLPPTLSFFPELILSFQFQWISEFFGVRQYDQNF